MALDKSFTEEVRLEVFNRQDGKCACCGKNLMGDAGPSLHHIKPRSLIKKSELEAGKSALNAAFLCLICHMDTHAATPETAKFRTKSWQEIGKTESDL